ncbi:hypothetical protein DXG03_002212 [Asterophora parasitica]|uniref:Uncharacterized protein n=1 Tax=Asterophora parasitica TaxID=117018 RepID=A0A9P7GCJ0_9AGAR|nr:hypothetical protein DXG03_002212 [Asterophora parasitica]
MDNHLLEQTARKCSDCKAAFPSHFVDSEIFQVLFMNKIDILRRKLDFGLRVGDYMAEYQEKSNDFSTDTKATAETLAAGRSSSFKAMVD